MVLSSAIVCDHDRRIADDRRSMFPYDRRRSQTLLRSAICDLRSAIIWRPAFMFYLLRSSAIMIAGSQTIAEVCFHMIADDRRPYCDLRSAIRDHMETSLKSKIHNVNRMLITMLKFTYRNKDLFSMNAVPCFFL